MTDPDQFSQATIDEIMTIYRQSAKRLARTVLHPPGNSPDAAKYNQARAAGIISQVNAQMGELKHQAAAWTGKAVTAAVHKGAAVADAQAEEAGLRPNEVVIAQSSVLSPQSSARLRGAFDLINTDAVRVLAQNTADHLVKAASSMADTAAFAIRKMAATGVTNQQVNQILAGRHIIEGQPQQAVLELRDLLAKVHGDKVTIIDKNGNPITYDTDYYAELVAVTKVRAVNRVARHERLESRGIDLVKVIGFESINPCSRLLGHIFSLSGRSDRYPAFSSVSEGQFPYRLFHPHCHKSTVPYIVGLSKPVEVEGPAPDLEAAA